MDQPEPEISIHRCTAKAMTFSDEQLRELYQIPMPEMSTR